MRSRLLLAVLIGLGAPVAVQAEPAKAPVAKAEQGSERQPVVVAAIAPDARVEISKAQQPADAAQAKPRRARVTTCRCGDQTPDSN